MCALADISAGLIACLKVTNRALPCAVRAASVANWSPQLVGEPNRLQAPAVDRFDSRPKRYSIIQICERR